MKRIKFGLVGNIKISGRIITKTGMHIGASADTVEIGGIDSPVIKHPLSNEPYIPGSSLKGKMRSLIEKYYYSKGDGFDYNRKVGTVSLHACNDLEFSYSYKDGKGAIKCPVCRVYGSTGKKTKDKNGQEHEGRNHPGRIIVRDCILTNSKKLKYENLLVFEAKMENAIDRITSSATPRTFERVPASAEFKFEIIYKVQGEFEDNKGMFQLSSTEVENIKTDLKNIFEALSLIEKDGIGGNISRGYGQVEFQFPTADKEINGEIKYYPVSGESVDIIPEKVEKTIEEIRKYEFSNLKDIILGSRDQSGENVGNKQGIEN